MNIPMQQSGPIGMNPMVQPNPVQMSPAQHQMHPAQTPMQQSQEKLDSISRIKSLLGPLRDSLSAALKTAAQTLHQNSLIDISKGTENPDQRFNKSIEEFYSICDQIELQLRTASECLGQNTSSMRYMPVSVMPMRSENLGVQDALSYPQYIMTVRTQIQYTKDIYNMLNNAARAISANE